MHLYDTLLTASSLSRIVVVGGGAAGASAASRAKRVDPGAEVYLIEATDMITHGPCGIPYVISGIIDRSRLMVYTPEVFEKERGIRVLINSRVVDIDVDKRIVEVYRNKRFEKLKWDKLILATGALPRVPGIPGISLDNVITIRHPAYADEIVKALNAKNVIAVVGGSYLGIEIVEGLLERGKKVLLFEMFNHLLPASIDEDMASIVEGEIVSKGVELHLSEKLVEIKGRSRAESIVTNKGEYRVDAVILATGVRPNIELAKEIGLRIGETGAVEVNEYMETSIEDIYAAGDLVEKYHRVLNKKVWIPLAPSANKEGLVAGANAVKHRFLKFPGIVGTAITKFYDLIIARTGLTENEAKQHNIHYEAKVIKARTKAHYYPGATEVHVKLIVEKSVGKVIGAQIIGKDHIVAGYVDIASVAIERGMTIEELFFSDLSYMPATAPVWHPLIVASRVLSKGKL